MYPGYGVFVVVWVAAVIVGGLACLGFQISVVRFIPEYLERKESGLLRGIIAGARLYGLAASTLLALLGAAGLALFGDGLSSYYVMPFYLAAICLPMLAIGEIQDGMSRAFNWAGLALWPTYVHRPLAILLFMWLAMQFGRPADAVTAMAATIAATYVVLVVGALLEPDRAAVYFATVKALAIVHFVYFAVRAGAAQRISQYYVAGDRSRLQAFIRDTLHWTFWPSLAISVALLVFRKVLLGLFGPAFVEGYPLFFIFIAGLLIRASVGPAEGILTMAGEQRICALVYALVFVLNVALNFLLIPAVGLAGAAIAIAIAISVEAVALAVLIRVRLGFNSWIGFAIAPPRRSAEAA